MAYGHPDWRPVGQQGSGRLLALAGSNAAFDITAAPGAGFAQVLYDLLLQTSVSTVQVNISEVTPANAVVRTIFIAIVGPTQPMSFPFGGVPLAPGNKVRCTATGGNTILAQLTYSVEAI